MNRSSVRLRWPAFFEIWFRWQKRNHISIGTGMPRGAYVNGDHIYWSDSSHNKLQDSDINGSSVETLLSMVNPLGIYAKTPDTV